MFNYRSNKHSCRHGKRGWTGDDDLGDGLRVCFIRLAEKKAVKVVRV